MRRRRWICSALLLIALPTAAQPVSPEVTALGNVIDLRGRLEHSSEHGCSQSFASSHHDASLELTVDANNVARLLIEYRSHRTFGPSPGRYMEGDHEFTQTGELARSVFSGRATRTPTGIEIHFDHAENASVTFTGYGSLPLPPATAAAVSIPLHCRLGLSPVLPAEWSNDEQPIAMTLLQCQFDALPEPLTRFETLAAVFGRGSGVRIVSEHRMWGAESSVVRSVL